MPDPAHRDIVVVGGGIIGVCSAYYILAALGDVETTSVTLVEEEAIACAASGKAGGFLALDWHGPATTSLARLSYGLHQELAAEYDGPNRWGYRDMDSFSFAISANDSSSPPEDSYALEESNFYVSEPNGDGEVEVDWLNPNGETTILGTTESTRQVHVLLINTYFLSH